MSKVFVSVGISLDGFIAGMNSGPKNPLGDRGMELHGWLFKQQVFRRHLKLGEDGETGVDNEIMSRITNRIGANIMGKRMFDEGEANWPEEAPFHCPVYVLTNESRRPWKRAGGTTFVFINDGIESALQKARLSAGPKDVRISGGADTIQQFLNAGHVDELLLHLVPVILGVGVRLFDNLDSRKFTFSISEAINSPEVTHLRYAVVRK